MSTSTHVAISAHLSLYPYKGLYAQLKYKCFTYYPHNYHSSCVRVRIKLILSNFLENKTKATLLQICMYAESTQRKDEKEPHHRLTRERDGGVRKKKKDALNRVL